MFNLVNLLLVGLVRFVRVLLILIVLPLERLVFLRVFDALTFLGALHVAGFATIRPLRVPLVQRYLRTVLLPLLPKIVVTPSISSRNNMVLPLAV